MSSVIIFGLRCFPRKCVPSIGSESSSRSTIVNTKVTTKNLHARLEIRWRLSQDREDCSQSGNWLRNKEARGNKNRRICAASRIFPCSHLLHSFGIFPLEIVPTPPSRPPPCCVLCFPFAPMCLFPFSFFKSVGPPWDLETPCVCRLL